MWRASPSTLLFSRAEAAPRPTDLKIATSTRGGTYFPLGKQLAWELEQGDYPSIGEAQADSTDGSIENIVRLVKGTADLAFAGESKLLTMLDKEQREVVFKDLDRTERDAMAQRVATLAWIPIGPVALTAFDQ